MKRLSHTSTLVFKILLLQLGFMSVVLGVPENLLLFCFFEGHVFFFFEGYLFTTVMADLWFGGNFPGFGIRQAGIPVTSRASQDTDKQGSAGCGGRTEHPIPAETFSPSSLRAGPVQLSVSLILVLALSLTGMWNRASSITILGLNFLVHTGIKASLLRHCKNLMK